MRRRLLSYGLVVLITLVLSEAFHPLALLQTSAQGCRTFTETGKTLCGRFLEYWNTHGGLAQQGFPISGEFTEVSDLNGKPYTVQYFERAVFEKHPENAIPNDVLLSQLGTFQFKRKYPGGDPSGGQPPAPNTPVPPAATQPPAPGEQPVQFNGTRDMNTPPVTLQGGTYEIAWTVDLQGENQTLFDVYLRSTNGSYSKLLVNTIVKQGEANSGTDLVYNVPAGQYYFDVSNTRETPWQITFTRK